MGGGGVGVFRESHGSWGTERGSVVNKRVWRENYRTLTVN